MGFVLVAARSHIAPVRDGVIDVLNTIGTIVESQRTVRDLSATAILLNMIEIAQRVLVLDLNVLFACKGYAPVRGVHSRQYHSARIPLRQTSIETIEQTGDIHLASSGVRRSRNSDVEVQSDSTSFRLR